LFSAQWPWYLAIALVIGAVEPLVGGVRHGSEPYVGHWLAYALGILAAGSIAVPLFGIAAWVIERERSSPNGAAAMVYRPAALPGLVFLGAMLKDFPSALTEIASYGYLGGIVFLLAMTFIIQKKKAIAWTWGFAIAVGFAIALVALLLAGMISLLFGQHP
jgi:hypothetical protein